MDRKMQDGMRNRDGAGRFELEGGTGGIVGMVGFRDFMEVYKIDRTFRVQTPDSVDPARTNPDAPWVASLSADVGSGNRIVARTVLQGSEMLKMAPEQQRTACTEFLLAVKEGLLTCERAKTRISDQYVLILQDIGEKGLVTDKGGRMFNPFPRVENLDEDCGVFLVQANRVIKSICELVVVMMDLKRPHSNFDHLLKELREKLNENNPLIEYVKCAAPGIRYLVDARNFHEHPRERVTVVKNFRVLPTGQIAVPSWKIDGGEDLHGEVNIVEIMTHSIEYLLSTVEETLALCVVNPPNPLFPLAIGRLPDDKIRPDKPYRYYITVDHTKLTFPSAN